MPYPDSVLRRGEHVLAHRRPHWRMLVVPALVAPVTAFVAAFLLALAADLAGVPGTLARCAVLAVAVAVVVLFALVPLLRWRCTRFVVTDRRLLVREGVLSRESIDVAGTSITAVSTRETGPERLVGCGTLVVTTSSTAAPWEFSGLGGVDRLAALTEQMADERGGLRALPADDDPDDVDDDEDPENADGDDWGAWTGDDEPARAVGAGSRFRRRRSAGRTSR